MSFSFINLILSNLSSKNVNLNKDNNNFKNFSTDFDNILFEIIQKEINSFIKNKTTTDNTFPFNIFKENISSLSFSTLNSLENNIKINLNKILDILNKKNLTLDDLKLLKNNIDKLLRNLRIIIENKNNISMEELNKFIFDTFTKIKNILNLEKENNVPKFSINQNFSNAKLTKFMLLHKRYKENLNIYSKKIKNKLVKKEENLIEDKKTDKDILKNIVSISNLLSLSILEIINETSKNLKTQNENSQKKFIKASKINFLLSKSNKESHNFSYLTLKEFIIDINKKLDVVEKNINNLHLLELEKVVEKSENKNLQKLNNRFFNFKNNNKIKKNISESILKNENLIKDNVNYYENLKNINNVGKNSLDSQKEKKKIKYIEKKNYKSVLFSKDFYSKKKNITDENLTFDFKDDKNFNDVKNFDIKNLTNLKPTEKKLDNYFNATNKQFLKLDSDENQKVESKSHIDNNLNFNSALNKQKSVINNYDNVQEVKVGKTSFLINEQKFPNLRVLNVYQNQENLLKVRYHLATGELALILKVENMPPLTLQLIRKEIESILDNYSIFKRKVRIKNEKREKDTKENKEKFSFISKKV